MRKRVNYQYYVEGENEKYFINTLKSELRCIIPGKVEKFNTIQDEFTTARIRTLIHDTIVILVFDTDVVKIDILMKNIELLKGQKSVKDVICIPQIKNLEDELIRCCNIKVIEELTHSCSKKDFKRDFLACKNLGSRLIKCGFDINKIWTGKPKGLFCKIVNGAEKIKIIK